MIKQNYTRSFFIFFVSILTLVLFCAWIFLIWQSYSYKSEIEKVRQEIGTSESRGRYLTSIKNVLRDTSADVASLETMFIIEQDVPKFIEYIESQAEEFKIKTSIDGIVLDPQKGEDSDASFRMLHVRISGEGEWKNLITFVHSLDTMPYLSRIDRVSFSKNSGEGVGWSVLVDISQNVR